MTFNNKQLLISITKIKMCRPETNPRSRNLILNMDWSIEYTTISQNKIEYICTIKLRGEMPIKYGIQGYLQYENMSQHLEKRYNRVSQLVIDHSMKNLLNMISSSKDIAHPIEDITTDASTKTSISIPNDIIW